MAEQPNNGSGTQGGVTAEHRAASASDARPAATPYPNPHPRPPASKPKGRTAQALSIFLSNPLNAARFQLDDRRGKRAVHTLTFDGLPLKVRTKSPDLTVVRAALLGEFEPAIARTGTAHGFIVDAGGYIGSAAIAFARAFPNAQVVSLEPSGENFALARDNCAPYPNITVINAALAAEDGTAQLRDRGTGQWGFTIAADGDAAGAVLGDVDTVTLPALMARYGKSGIDLLKLDIEGGEYDVFQAAANWLPVTDVVFTELHERIRPGVTALYRQTMAEREEIDLGAEKNLSVRRAG